jgi:prepilin-type N-terminal cleavage/methylation domain-containing protein
MKNQKAKSKNHTFIPGFTIVECLIGLAISAILLAAVAAAFSASLTNYRENERMYQTINSARQALMRMTSQLRTAGYQVSPVLFVAVDASLPLVSDHCNFYTATGENLSYIYSSTDKKLYLRTNSNNQQYTLCDNVVAASFVKTLTDDGTDCKSVQISLTVENGGFRRTLSAAAVIRRNLGA